MASRPIVDVDAHYYDHFERLERYVDDDDPWKGPFRRAASDPHPAGGLKSLFPTSTPVSSGTRERTISESRDDVADVMDRLGVDVSIQLSNLMLSFSLMNSDDRRPIVLANAYVDYMLDRIADPGKGIYLLVPVPYNDVDASVDLIDRVGDERAVVGICLVSAGAEPPFGHHRYDPIYEAAQRHDLAVVFHGTGESLDGFDIAGYSKFLETHTLGFLWANIAQLTSIVVQGVPEKFPNLDIVFQECGIFWVPMMMYRLDSEYLRREWDAPLLEKRPSEYLKEFYYGTQPIEYPPDIEYFEHVIEMAGGADRFMYASDYPHGDYDEPTAITDMGFLSRPEKAKILGGNAEEVFDL